MIDWQYRKSQGDTDEIKPLSFEQILQADDDVSQWRHRHSEWYKKRSKMRSRTKECHTCRFKAEALYRCRYDGSRDWLFLCGKCLAEVRAKHENTYQYGGTWKRKKR